jgi:transcriptional regulator with XRE-family HTH domain
MLVKDMGRTILERRNALKITQPHLAELAGISVNSLYKIEKGQSNPTLELIEKIAEVLGLELKLEVKKVKL